MPESECIENPFISALTVATPIKGGLAKMHGVSHIAVEHQTIDYHHRVVSRSICRTQDYHSWEAIMRIWKIP